MSTLSNVENIRDPIKDREVFMSGLRMALRGEREVHVWRGDLSPWMDIVIVEPGAEVSPRRDVPSEFIKTTGMYYDGTMEPEEIVARLEEMLAYGE